MFKNNFQYLKKILPTSLPFDITIVKKYNFKYKKMECFDLVLNQQNKKIPS